MLWWAECQASKDACVLTPGIRAHTTFHGEGDFSCCCSVAESCLTLVTPWTAAHQAPLSMGFSRQEYWSGLPFPPPGNLPNPGGKPTSPALAGGCFTTEPPGKPERDFSDVINIGFLTGKRRRRKQRLRWLDSVTD